MGADLDDFDVAEDRAVLGADGELVRTGRETGEEIEVTPPAGEQGAGECEDQERRGQQPSPVRCGQPMRRSGREHGPAGEQHREQQEGAKVAQVGDEEEGGHQDSRHRSERADEEHALSVRHRVPALFHHLRVIALQRLAQVRVLEVDLLDL